MKFVLLAALIAGQPLAEIATYDNALACNNAAIDAANKYAISECHGPGTKNPTGVVTYVLPKPVLQTPRLILEIR